MCYNSKAMTTNAFSKMLETIMYPYMAFVQTGEGFFASEEWL